MAGPAAQSVQRRSNDRYIANLPPEVIAQIQDTYGMGELTVLPLPYWSAVRFQATRAAGPPVVLTVAAGERKAFAYPIGQSPAIAGFGTAFGNATEAETNLLRPSETRDNADFWIWGIGCAISHPSEPAIAEEVWRSTSVRLALNGTTSIPLGRLEMFPGAGGLYGAGRSAALGSNFLDTGPSDGGVGAVVPFMSNGVPAAGDFFRLLQPFKWSSVGNSGSDSSLVLSFLLQRDITVTCGLARTLNAPAATTTGTAAYTPPADLARGTYVDVITHLIGVSVAKRSVNV
jgi:hypothetical protein